jgi:AraC family transcriptional regulator
LVKHIPDLTSVAGLQHYPAGKRTGGSEGDAWRDVQLTFFSLDSEAEQFSMPAVSEPFIVWVTSGEAQTRERELDSQSWRMNHVKTDSLFLTAGGEPYEFSWQRVSDDPFEVTLFFISLPLLNQALESVYGKDASEVGLTDLSGFSDPELIKLLRCLQDEALRHEANALYVRGIAQAIAVHLAREYCERPDGYKATHSALPAHKLKRINNWMKAHLPEEFSLAHLADMADMSEFHFNRLFKKAMGMPPSQYFIKLRIEAAKLLLRETKLNILEIANEVGYANPSHFAQLFRRETGETPRQYRKL